MALFHLARGVALMFRRATCLIVSARLVEEQPPKRSGSRNLQFGEILSSVRERRTASQLELKGAYRHLAVVVGRDWYSGRVCGLARGDTGNRSAQHNLQQTSRGGVAWPRATSA